MQRQHVRARRDTLLSSADGASSVDAVAGAGANGARRSSSRTPWVTYGLVALGIAIRFRQWSGARSLWLDEAMVSLNILNRSYRDLVRELDYGQAAPVAWLWSERAALELFGATEPVLRLVPLLCGIAVVVLMVPLAERVVGSSRGWVAVGIVALSPGLIRYSNEVKQYEIDALAYTLLTLLAVVVVDERAGSRRWRIAVATWAGVGAAAVWGSHPAVLILACTAVVVVIPLARSRQMSSICWWIGACTVWGASWVGMYLVSLRRLSEDEGFANYWHLANAFPRQPLDAGSVLDWLRSNTASLVDSPLGFGLPVLAVAVVLGGAVALVSRRKIVGVLVVSPLGPFLALAVTSQYPFYGRLALALVPIAALCVAAVVPTSLGSNRTSSVVRIALVIVLIGVLAPPVARASRLLVERYEFQEMRRAAEIVAAEAEPTDYVMATPGSQFAVRFYAQVLGFTPHGVFLARPSGECGALTDFDPFAGRRVWLLLGHRLKMSEDEEQELVEQFGFAGLVEQRFEDEGASLWVVDATAPPELGPADWPPGRCLRFVVTVRPPPV